MVEKVQHQIFCEININLTNDRNRLTVTNNISKSTAKTTMLFITIIYLLPHFLNHLLVSAS